MASFIYDGIARFSGQYIGKVKTLWRYVMSEMLNVHWQLPLEGVESTVAKITSSNKLDSTPQNYFTSNCNETHILEGVNTSCPKDCIRLSEDMINEINEHVPVSLDPPKGDFIKMNG